MTNMMTTGRRIGTFFAAAISLLLLGCKPSVPSEYISPGDMEDLLYDYYLSQAMADIDTKDGRMGYNRRLYFLSVLKKHGVTEAEFDSSMVYYYSRADYMRKIYANLQERIDEETTGAAAAEMRKRFVVGGDTADVWREKKAFFLTPAVPYNRVDFTVKADTAFRKGDTYLLTFDTNFLYQSGTKDATIYMAVRYATDSIASYTRTVSMTGITELRVTPNDDEMVRDIRGFIYLDRGRDETSTLKMMFVNNIQFLRMRKQKDKGTPSLSNGSPTVAKGDSAARQRSDSLRPIPHRPNTPPLPPNMRQQPLKTR